MEAHQGNLCSKDPFGGSGQCGELEIDLIDLLEQETGARWDKDHVWLRDPQEYTRTALYTAYKNQMRTSRLSCQL